MKKKKSASEISKELEAYASLDKSIQGKLPKKVFNLDKMKEHVDYQSKSNIMGVPNKGNYKDYKKARELEEIEKDKVYKEKLKRGEKSPSKLERKYEKMRRSRGLLMGS